MTSRNITITASYGYVRPWRSRRYPVQLKNRGYSGALGVRQIERARFRYLIVAEYCVAARYWRYVVIGRVWTKRGAIRAVDALRAAR